MQGMAYLEEGPEGDMEENVKLILFSRRSSLLGYTVTRS